MNKIISRIASIRLFFVLSGIVLVACVLGGLIPQGESPDRYRDMFGSTLGGLIVRSSLATIFSSAWFNLALVLLGINLAACSWIRLSALKRRPGVFVTHVSVLLILAGAALRGLIGERGTLNLTVGEPAHSYIDARGTERPLPFEVALDDFRLDYWEAPEHRISMSPKNEKTFAIDPEAPVELGDLGKLTMLDFFPDFVVTDNGPASRSPYPNNPALRLSLSRNGKDETFYLFQNYPEFHGNHEPPLYYRYMPGNIRQYRSFLRLTSADGKSLQKTIWVNNPVRFKGFALYQSSYDPGNPKFSGLQVARDPGVPLVYSGFVLLPIGLFWSFYGKSRGQIEKGATA